MKRLLFLILLSLFAINARTQNLFFLGDKSYPCTSSFGLTSNSDFGNNGLSVLIAKDVGKALIALEIETMGPVYIRGKAMIYLEDGTVISLTDRLIYDRVDNKSTTVFYLTLDEIKKLKTSNINTIRYSLKCGAGCQMSTEEGDFSSSNKGSYLSNKVVDVPSLVKSLYPD
jgi:hypothetical protein